VIREILATTSLATPSKEANTLQTVYFGGGTPSLLPAHCIARIIEALSSSLGGLSRDVEVTLEMDPGTFDSTKLRDMRQAGVNRISLGVQSFDDTMLKECGRAHTSSDVLNALAIARDVGVDNISIDLISSLPHMTVDLWANTLDKAVGSGCSHISVYDLQVEDKTAFGRWYTPGSFPLPTDEESALMFKMAVDRLTLAGFEHYEVSNYAKKGRRSRHNQFYWKCAPTWGFGLGAASFTGGYRYTRPSSLADYQSFVNRLENELQRAKHSKIHGDDGDIASIDQDIMSLVASFQTQVSTTHVNFYNGADALEVIMLSLRTSDGLDIPSFNRTFGGVVTEAALRALRPFVDRGLVEFKSGEDVVRLTESGFLVSNDIISSVFSKLPNG